MPDQVEKPCFGEHLERTKHVLHFKYRARTLLHQTLRGHNAGDLLDEKSARPMRPAPQPAIRALNCGYRLFSEKGLRDGPKNAICHRKLGPRTAMKKVADSFVSKQMKFWHTVQLRMLTKHCTDHGCERAWRCEYEKR